MQDHPNSNAVGYVYISFNFHQHADTSRHSHPHGDTPHVHGDRNSHGYNQPNQHVRLDIDANGNVNAISPAASSLRWGDSVFRNVHRLS